MRSSIAQSVPWVGKAAGRRGGYGIGNALARSALDESFAIGAAAHPADVILVSHTLSIKWCAVRVRRRVLPIRRSVRTGRWSTPDVGRGARGVARMGFDYTQSGLLNTPLTPSISTVFLSLSK